MKVRDLRTKLTRLGCEPVRIRGSHEQWRTPRGVVVPLVVNHKNADVTPNIISTWVRVLRGEGLQLLEKAG